MSFAFKQTAYQLTTAGKFSESIVKMKSILLNVTLLAVDTKQEITEVSWLVLMSFPLATFRNSMKLRNRIMVAIYAYVFVAYMK